MTLVAVVAVTALAALAAGAANSAGVKTSAQAKAQAKSPVQKAVFFAADGMRQDIVARYAAQGLMPTMSDFLKKGTSASGNGLLTQAPPNTGAGWYSLATGAWPGVHGSTNNTFHRNGQPFANRTAAFDPGFAPARVERVTRRDGGFVLRSPTPLAPYSRCVGDWLVQWARRTPQRTWLAERGPAGWRTVTYAQGLDNAQIAARLELSEKTVRNHITSIFDKIGVESRAQAIVMARERGLGQRSHGT